MNGNAITLKVAELYIPGDDIRQPLLANHVLLPGNGRQEVEGQE